MASDQHTIEALSGMLRDDETRMNPIFGCVKNGEFKQSAYLGFTKLIF